MLKPATSSRTVSSVAQAIAILRMLGSTGDAMGVNAIARQQGLAPSSCFNILKTLLDENVVTFDPATKLYRIGLGAINLANMALGSDGTAIAAKPFMQGLAVEFDAAIGLWRMDGQDRLTLIHLAESEAGTRIHMMVGQRQPFAGGATGRALMAARKISAEELRQAFEAVRWQLPVSYEQYAAQVEDAGRHGHALDVDQMFRGITTVAAAIAARGGGVACCLSASVFSRRNDRMLLRRLGEALSTAAKTISDQS